MMKVELPDDFHDGSKVWIYQSTRQLSKSEEINIREEVSRFTKTWISHNNQLKAHGDVLLGYFIVLTVDESEAGASGCSIDKSVHFIKYLEEKYGLSLFDRTHFAFIEGQQISLSNINQFGELYRSGKIDDETIVFDNLVRTKSEFNEKWQKHLKDSWHSRFV